MTAMKEAKTDYEIHELISDRWSPRAFSDKTIDQQDLMRLFDAARWAASSMNEQPWKFFYGHRGTSAFDAILATLMEGNQEWANDAAVLVAVTGKTHHDYKSKPNRTWQYDLGLAVGNLTLQATSMGIYLHQMGGVHLDKMNEALQLPDNYEPFVAIALGYKGDPDQLSDKNKKSETAERSRNDLSEVAVEAPSAE